MTPANCESCGHLAIAHADNGPCMHGLLDDGCDCVCKGVGVS